MKFASQYSFESIGYGIEVVKPAKPYLLMKYLWFRYGVAGIDDQNSKTGGGKSYGVIDTRRQGSKHPIESGYVDRCHIYE